MSARVEKATRRDLRRAVGEEATQTIEQCHSAIGALRTLTANQHTEHSQRMTDLRRRVFALESDNGPRLGHEAYRVTGRTRFWGRLLWLLTGK